MSNVERVRIAPSPTGHLHVGTARTALYNYLFARRYDGRFIFRLEDTDEVRSQEAYTEDIIKGLQWLGLSWDEGPDIGGQFAPYRQTEKIKHYAGIADRLIAEGKAYHCYATPEELDELREQQKANSQAPRYDNRGRSYTQADIERFKEEGRVPVVRFKIDDNKIVSWNDGIKGVIEIAAGDLGGDMVIVKSNGIAIYNFAVVVDDVDMQISTVIRGEDHIHNTAKQILIYEALGVPVPRFAHVPLIFDMDRQKLSKRKHGEFVHVEKYRQEGYMPEALVNYLAQMSWTPADGREIFTLAEACRMFELDRVSKSPAIFDIQRLNWFNAHYIRHLPLAVIVERARPFLAAYPLEDYTPDDLNRIVELLREGLTSLSEMTAAARLFFVQDVEISGEIFATIISKESSRKVLESLLVALPELPFADPKGCKAAVDLIGKTLGLKGKELYWPVRAAISGATSGPDLGNLISILGKNRVQSRLESALQVCTQH